MSRLRAERGVTLVELVITIVLLGIIGGIGAMVLLPAFEAYFAAQRRADLADAADTALRRLSRDVRLALPNSARVDGSQRYLEFLLAKNGGRYRAAHDEDPLTSEDPLLFDAPDGAFDTLGALATFGDQQVQAGDYVVLHNLGIPGANAYDVGAASPNIAQISAFASVAGGNRITLAAATQFPFESPGRRFFVVSGPVTYACVGVGLDAQGTGTGTLQRWWGYPIELRGGQPPTTLPGGGASAVLAHNLSACELRYSNLAHLSRGLVVVRLGITRRQETVTLFHEIHVDNVP
ncbi:MAG TPA: type II secretion system protein [Burkholderiales bacterium]|nr:type II secretion system protein [Burkholderiales bacterium]